MNSRNLPKARPNLAHVHGFTFGELLTCLAVCALLLAIVLPALAHDRARASRIQCLNNLRQIGVGMALWGDDHGGEPPHHVLFSEGGSRRHPLSENAWVHFSYISNDLVSPKVLLCPSDTGVPASDFSGSPTEGYLHPNFRNRATSYFLAFTYYADDYRIQSGDRNIYSQGAKSSSYFNTSAFVTMNPLNPEFRWMPGLHGDSGNLLFTDGQVEQADTARLRSAAERGADFYAGFHDWRFLLPR